MPIVDEPFPPVNDELLEVRRRRYKEARTAGLSIVESKMFADGDQDIGLLRLCVANGWTPAQIALVML